MISVVSHEVGRGDMFSIRHGNGTLTIIDCNITQEYEEDVWARLGVQSAGSELNRFISTHPDEDHLCGLESLCENLPIHNFYCVANRARKSDPSSDFDYYCQLRDRQNTFHLERGMTNHWLNRTDNTRSSSGISVLWPDPNDLDFLIAQFTAMLGQKPNNISPILLYSIENGPSFMWMGDLERDLLEKISDKVVWPRVEVLFAPHHGRDSARVPTTILQQLNPSIIVLGQAPSEHLHYYPGYNTITQNSAGTIVFQPHQYWTHVYCSKLAYSSTNLFDLDFNRVLGPHYKGSFLHQL